MANNLPIPSALSGFQQRISSQPINFSNLNRTIYPSAMLPRTAQSLAAELQGSNIPQAQIRAVETDVYVNLPSAPLFGPQPLHSNSPRSVTQIQIAQLLTNPRLFVPDMPNR